MPDMTATSDEISHIPSGYTYLKTGEIRLNPQHPPFIKILAALAILPLDPTLNLNHPGWKADPPNEWTFGEEFLYSNDIDKILFRSRLPVVLLSILLGMFVYRWAAELFGAESGLLALFLYVLSPNILAHSRIVTMDLGLTCFVFLFCYYLWKCSRRRTISTVLLAGLCLGLALATKFSAVILLPVFGVVLALIPFLTRRQGRNERSGFTLAAVTGIIAIACIIVWVVYMFPTDAGFYLDGLSRVNTDHDPNRAYYLMGDFKVGGHALYFPMAFLLKTPLPTLLLLGLSIFLWKKCPAPRKPDELFLLLPAGAFFLATTLLADDLGVRYLLPVWPFMFVFVSRSWRWLASKAALKVAGGVLAFWYIISAAWIYPDHLAFFSLAAGGPANGYRYLSDSNLDWGQDLKRLSRYLDDNDLEPVRLMYYPWSGRPAHYGIASTEVTPRDWYQAPRPGTYVMSVFWLIQGLNEADTKGTPTDWLDRYEPYDRVGYSFFVYRFDEEGGTVH
jgi:hypothetical protein